MSVAGIVLTGGRSRRMGADKATLVVNGRRMVDRVVETMRGSGVGRIIVAGPPLSEPGPDVEFRPDSGDEPQGPMAGITSAWGHIRSTSAHARPDPILVVACDLPDLQSAVLDELLARSHDAEHGAIASDGEVLQPLLAAYRPAALDQLVVAFANGERSVRSCLGSFDLVVLAFDRELVADADTPGDLARFHVDWPGDTGETACR